MKTERTKLPSSKMKIKKLSGKTTSNGKSVDYKLYGYKGTSNVGLDMCMFVGIYIRQNTI